MGSKPIALDEVDNFYKVYMTPFEQIQSNLMGDNEKDDELTAPQDVEGGLPF